MTIVSHDHCTKTINNIIENLPSISLLGKDKNVLKYKLHLKLNYKLIIEIVLMRNLINVVKNRMHDRNNAHLLSKMCDSK